MAEAEGACWEGGVKQTKLSGLRRCDTVNFEVGMPLHAESSEDLCALRLSDKPHTLTVTAIDHDAGEITVGVRRFQQHLQALVIRLRGWRRARKLRRMLDKQERRTRGLLALVWWLA